MIIEQFTDPSDHDDSSEKKTKALHETSEVAEAAKQSYYKELVSKVLARYAAETEGKTNHPAQDKCEDARIHVHQEDCKMPARCEPKSSTGEEESGGKTLLGAKEITDHDVLFGRRSAHRNNPGNIRLRELCSTLYLEYRDGNLAQKTSLIWRIVRVIQSEGGRFKKLVDDQSAWREVSNYMARKKVAFTIRDLDHSDCM